MISRARLRAIGSDGLTTLGLSTALVLASGGISLLFPLHRVIRIARGTPAAAEGPAVLAVFGKRLRANAPDPEFLQRLERARNLYASGHAKRIILLGGTTGDAECSEAAAGAGYLVSKGVPESLLELEDRSRHTLENLDHARRLVDAGSGTLVVLVTSRYHLARCSVLADGFSIPHTLCAAEPRLVWRAGLLALLLGEAFYLHWYWVGKGWSRLIRNQKSLNRIR